MISSASARAAAEPRLRLRGIRKVYPGVVANDGIDLAVMPGEIHAVLGENGAGKSTLMKVICGVTPPTDGEMLWEGEPALPADPSHARAIGIGMVFQHFSLFETLTVVENVALTLTGASDLAALEDARSGRLRSAGHSAFGLIDCMRRKASRLGMSYSRVSTKG